MVDAKLAHLRGAGRREEVALADDLIHGIPMSSCRVALANLAFPVTPEASVEQATEAVALAGREAADIICFPECFVPGYRAPNKNVPPPDAAFLDRAWSAVEAAAGAAKVAVILGTERIAGGRPMITALVVDRDGTRLGFQDKVQIDPSEEITYTSGAGRRTFQSGALTFGVVICHEGWRYPETVRWAARRGAQVVFHPQFHEADAGSYRPVSYADPKNTFHEKAALCRAAENTCYFATVNFAGEGSPTTSAVVRPDGTLLGFQPYGQPGLFIADLDLSEATGLLATRCRDY
jgi:predicted amidohydrolase